MPIDINDTVLQSNANFFTITANDGITLTTLYEQSNTGITTLPRITSGFGAGNLVPLFNVGWGTSTSGFSFSSGSAIIFSYTSGSGYYNSGNFYNTGNGRFTAPYTGVYLFKQSILVDANSTAIGFYLHPYFYVNGSQTSRRIGIPTRIRLYGKPANYRDDTDCCEQIYLFVGDYVDVRIIQGSTTRGYPAFSSWSGAFLGG